MIYLLILLFVEFILAFSIKILIACSFIKFFNRSKSLKELLEPVLIYEFGVFCFFDLLNQGNSFPLLPWLKWIFGLNTFFITLFILLFLIGILFFIFRFIMKGYSLLNFKQSLALFFIIFFIITPIIFLSQSLIEDKMLKSFSEFGTYVSFLEESNHFPGMIPRSPLIALGVEIRKLNNIFLEKELLTGFKALIIMYAL